MGRISGQEPCVRLVTFFDENNDVTRVLKPEEEARLRTHCSPYLQDLVVFAVSNGLRAGDILNLTWEAVDLEGKVIKAKIRKNRKQLEVPLN
jgi:integrase